MKKKNILLAGLLLLGMAGCSLDYENTGAISPDDVWKKKDMIDGFLNDIYGRMNPEWPRNANNTDEGMNLPGQMSDFARGIYTVEGQGQKLGYGNIDRINFFIEKLDNEVTVLSETEKEQMKGQALFWRAWDYFGKVNTVGGVPLILKFQDVMDVPSLFVSRNLTSECINQIVADLDEAISYLPDTWGDNDYGRIDKGTAMAFKGRVLMFYASPMYNPDNDRARWETAYQANKDAVDFLKAQGKGLYQGKFEDIWYDEQNCEVVMVNQFYYPDHALDQKNIRPQPLSKDAADDNQAILSLLLAFPKADGSKLELDVDRLSDLVYNEQFMTEFYTNRDPRFHATIFCPGTVYPTKDDKLSGGKKYWNTWKMVKADDGFMYASMIDDELNTNIGGGKSGFFQKKGVDPNLTIATVYQAETDWIEIRFAEVLMNYGECANEIGKTDEALNVLYQIRERAGIPAGTSHYGITATSQSDVREAYVDERFIEFAYEGKRWNDLRRWKRFDILNRMKYRSILYPVIKNNADVATFDWTSDMTDAKVRKLFRFDYIENIDNMDDHFFNLDEKYMFYPIHKEVMDRNSKIEQNVAWGGTFDPLK
ncbi:RagB/SusD family nutrient uptake outer membrane protein [uncultured Phocaeicola sp.]|uniref:RagB/SusD family nutrient uptake outer membrane protein n=1 Tax=uncultured Phocaeicola sp. TaxID=990718 RepID=UPI0014353266|nr:RagB/SusD family nutrient uptake outer membrane protein [uncultured Phocaeicola sp.]GFH98038.1 hypothetical protein IMSAGC004_00424 [Bacteroidaceae bacterium]